MSDQETERRPSDDDWYRATEVGQRIVREVLAEKAGRRLQRGAGMWDLLAVGFGANKATIDFILLCADPKRPDAIEQILVATVRGICRDAETPINDDGTPFLEPQ
jgi:hypothetical protein